MLTPKIILQVLTFGLLFLTVTLDYMVSDRRTRWFKRLRIGLSCVAVLSLVAGIWVTVDDDIARREEIAALSMQLNRGLHPIEDVAMEFLALLPMDNPTHSGIAAYTKRILPALHSLASSLPSQEPTTWGPISVPFISKSPLFPDLERERVAYSFLSHVCVGLEIFADSAKADTFIPLAGHSQGAGDLVFLLSRSAGQAVKNDVFLGLDINKKMFSLNGVNAKLGPSQKSSGRIVAVPDLAGATAVVYFCPRGDRDEAENAELLSIANELQLVFFGLTFSGGQQIHLRPEGWTNKYGERVYILRFPKTVKEVEALIQG